VSRVSLNRRLQTILEQAERIDPGAARVHRMAPAVRRQHEAWRAECDAMHERFTREGGPGAAYAALLAGEFVTPEPPRAVAGALQIPAVPVLHEGMTCEELTRMWADTIDG
jgi:hypothetical protein